MTVFDRIYRDKFLMDYPSEIFVTGKKLYGNPVYPNFPFGQDWDEDEYQYHIEVNLAACKINYLYDLHDVYNYILSTKGQKDADKTFQFLVDKISKYIDDLIEKNKKGNYVRIERRYVKPQE